MNERRFANVVATHFRLNEEDVLKMLEAEISYEDKTQREAKEKPDRDRAAAMSALRMIDWLNDAGQFEPQVSNGGIGHFIAIHRIAASYCILAMRERGYRLRSCPSCCQDRPGFDGLGRPCKTCFGRGTVEEIPVLSQEAFWFAAAAASGASV